MSVSKFSRPQDKKRFLDPETPVPSAQGLQTRTQNITKVGMTIDVLWHHYLRQFYIGPPRALQTFGIYAFWASVWYCASHSGDWTHAAIARDRDKITTEPLRTYDVFGDHRAVRSAEKARNVPLERVKAHVVTYCSLTTVAVLAHLTYAYRPWFWHRRLPAKVTWFGMAVFTSLNAVIFTGAAVNSRSRVWEERTLEQDKTGRVWLSNPRIN